MVWCGVVWCGVVWCGGWWMVVCEGAEGLESGVMGWVEGSPGLHVVNWSNGSRTREPLAPIRLLLQTCQGSLCEPRCGEVAFASHPPPTLHRVYDAQCERLHADTLRNPPSLCTHACAPRALKVALARPGQRHVRGAASLADGTGRRTVTQYMYWVQVTSSGNKEIRIGPDLEPHKNGHKRSYGPY